MAENKKSFVLYCDLVHVIRKLIEQDRKDNTNYSGELFLHILEYVNDEEPKINKSIEDLYLSITEQIVLEWNKINPKTGKYHWNYKGGITPENRIIRNSQKMQIWRNDVFERDGYKCQKCNKIGGKLNAHHIKRFSEYPELRFDASNGITLCRSCHILEHKINRT